MWFKSAAFQLPRLHWVIFKCFKERKRVEKENIKMSQAPRRKISDLLCAISAEPSRSQGMPW